MARILQRSVCAQWNGEVHPEFISRLDRQGEPIDEDGIKEKVTSELKVAPRPRSSGNFFQTVVVKFVHDKGQPLIVLAEISLQNLYARIRTIDETFMVAVQSRRGPQAYTQ
jgi:hypothetical protein